MKTYQESLEIIQQLNNESFNNTDPINLQRYYFKHYFWSLSDDERNSIFYWIKNHKDFAKQNQVKKFLVYILELIMI